MDKLSFFVDGYLIGEKTVPGYDGNSNINDLLIGAEEFRGNDPAIFWKGIIDDLRIYGRALHPMEIQALYLSYFFPSINDL